MALNRLCYVVFVLSLSDCDAFNIKTIGLYGGIVCGIQLIVHIIFRQMSPQKSTYSIGYVYVILHIDNTDIFMGCCFTHVRRF